MSIPRPFPFLRRLALFSLALALPLAFSACGGGNDSGNGSSDGSAPYDHKPAFDCSGSWATTFDGVYLGTTVFNMARDGKLTGTMKLANGESGNLNGHLAAHQAEWTIAFPSVSYLASVTFDASHNNGSGTMVTSSGVTHTLSLSR